MGDSILIKSMSKTSMVSNSSVVIETGAQVSRHTEPVVVVAEGRIELAAQRHAAQGVGVPPRSTTGGAPHAVIRTRRISLRRTPVIIRVVPVRAPLVHICGDAEEAEVRGLAERHGPRRFERPASTVGNPGGHNVTPRE